MWLYDLLTRFDDALDWQIDDPLLADRTPPEDGQDQWPRSATVAA